MKRRGDVFPRRSVNATRRDSWILKTSLPEDLGQRKMPCNVFVVKKSNHDNDLGTTAGTVWCPRFCDRSSSAVSRSKTILVARIFLSENNQWEIIAGPTSYRAILIRPPMFWHFSEYITNHTTQEVFLHHFCFQLLTFDVKNNHLLVQEKIRSWISFQFFTT